MRRSAVPRVAGTSFAGDAEEPAWLAAAFTLDGLRTAAGADWDVEVLAGSADDVVELTVSAYARAVHSVQNPAAVAAPTPSAKASEPILPTYCPAVLVGWWWDLQCRWWWDLQCMRASPCLRLPRIFLINRNAVTVIIPLSVCSALEGKAVDSYWQTWRCLLCGTVVS